MLRFERQHASLTRQCRKLLMVSEIRNSSTPRDRLPRPKCEGARGFLSGWRRDLGCLFVQAHPRGTTQPTYGYYRQPTKLASLDFFEAAKGLVNIAHLLGCEHMMGALIDKITDAEGLSANEARDYSKGSRCL